MFGQSGFGTGNDFSQLAVSQACFEHGLERVQAQLVQSRRLSGRPNGAPGIGQGPGAAITERFSSPVR